MKPPAVKYTNEQSAAMKRLAKLLNEANEYARIAGCRRFTWKFVTGNGNRFESDYDRRHDPERTPYAEGEFPVGNS